MAAKFDHLSWCVCVCGFVGVWVGLWVCVGVWVCVCVCGCMLLCVLLQYSRVLIGGLSTQVQKKKKARKKETKSTEKGKRGQQSKLRRTRRRNIQNVRYSSQHNKVPDVYFFPKAQVFFPLPVQIVPRRRRRPFQADSASMMLPLAIAVNSTNKGSVSGAVLSFGFEAKHPDTKAKLVTKTTKNAKFFISRKSTPHQPR